MIKQMHVSVHLKNFLHLKISISYYFGITLGSWQSNFFLKTCTLIIETNLFQPKIHPQLDRRGNALLKS